MQIHLPAGILCGSHFCIYAASNRKKKYRPLACLYYTQHTRLVYGRRCRIAVDYKPLICHGQGHR